MWFGNSVKPDGYIFLKFEGKVSASGSSPLKDFKYNLGSNDNLKTIQTALKNIAIIPKNVTFVHLNVNYAKLFNGIDLSKTEHMIVNSPFQNTQSIAKRMVQNIPLIFENEE